MYLFAVIKLFHKNDVNVQSKFIISAEFIKKSFMNVQVFISCA